MRSRGAVELEAWVAKQGGLRAAARVLGVGHGAVRRWTTGENVPADRGALERQTGVVAASWDQAAQQAPAPPVQPTKRGARPGPAPAARPALVAAEATPPPAPPPVAPATLEELQRRARQIPGELQRLRESIGAGDVAFSAGEVMARMLEREARAVAGAITAAGTATVEEVEQLRALVLDVTRGCEGCRARVTAALRGGS